MPKVKVSDQIQISIPSYQIFCRDGWCGGVVIVMWLSHVSLCLTFTSLISDIYEFYHEMDFWIGKWLIKILTERKRE